MQGHSAPAGLRLAPMQSALQVLCNDSNLGCTACAIADQTLPVGSHGRPRARSSESTYPVSRPAGTFVCSTPEGRSTVRPSKVVDGRLNVRWSRLISATEQRKEGTESLVALWSDNDHKVRQQQGPSRLVATCEHSFLSSLARNRNGSRWQLSNPVQAVLRVRLAAKMQRKQQGWPFSAVAMMRTRQAY